MSREGLLPFFKAMQYCLKAEKALHGPDRMYIDARHIILVEPVGASSEVAKLIEESKKE